MHSIDSGTTVRRHTRDDGQYGLLGTTVAGHVLGAVAVAGGYYATAQLGAALQFPSAPVSALWFPNALLLGALLLAPRRYWWVYLLAVLPAHLLAQLPLPDVTTARVLVQYVLNIGTALIAAFALTHHATEPLRFDRSDGGQGTARRFCICDRHLLHISRGANVSPLLALGRFSSYA